MARARAEARPWQRQHIKGGVSPNTYFFYELAQLAPYKLTHVRASPGDCAAGWAQAARKRFESSEALAELPAVARTAVELHGCCARVSLAAALLSQHIDGVARACFLHVETVL